MAATQAGEGGRVVAAIGSGLEDLQRRHAGGNSDGDAVEEVAAGDVHGNLRIIYCYEIPVGACCCGEGACSRWTWLALQCEALPGFLGPLRSPAGASSLATVSSLRQG